MSCWGWGQLRLCHAQSRVGYGGQAFQAGPSCGEDREREEAGLRVHMSHPLGLPSCLDPVVPVALPS